MVAAVYNYPLFHIEKPQLQCEAERVGGAKGRGKVPKKECTWKLETQLVYTLQRIEFSLTIWIIEKQLEKY